MKKLGFRRGDAVVAALVLAAAAFSFLLLPARTTTAGGTAVVSVDGTAVYTIDLTGEAADIELSDLPYPMTLHVEHGAIHVSESDCPGRDCVRQGTISLDGESIVCLPNRVTIVIRSETLSGLDGIAG